MKKFRSLLMLIIICVVIFSCTTISRAATLVLTTGTSAPEIKIGSNVVVTVDWKEEMQAADFVLKYDSSKLEYQSSSISDSFIRVVNGEVRISWFSTSGTENLEKATFTFKGIAEGDITFSTKVDGGFSNKNLTQPDAYNVDSTVSVKVIGTPGDSNDSNDSGTETPGTGENNSGSQGTGNNNNNNKPSGNSGTSKPSQGSSSSASTAPTQKPTSLPKAGAKNILIALPFVLIVMCISYYKLKEYKDI